MKKAYQKPGIYIESFAFSQSIAAGCKADPDSTFGGPLQSDKSSCAWGDSSVAIWTNEVQDCTTKWGEDDEFSGVCYNNPSPNTAIFSLS